jgi:hypothetical protein
LESWDISLFQSIQVELLTERQLNKSYITALNVPLYLD